MMTVGLMVGELVGVGVIRIVTGVSVRVSSGRVWAWPRLVNRQRERPKSTAFPADLSKLVWVESLFSMMKNLMNKVYRDLG
jgi:hypothetical protein